MTLRKILFFCFISISICCCLPDIDSNEKKNMDSYKLIHTLSAFDVIDKLVLWIEDFKEIQLRMPLSFEELFEKLPHRKVFFERFQESGFIISYSYMDDNNMIIKVKDREDTYECHNENATFYFYLNGNITREFTRAADGVELINERFSSPPKNTVAGT